MRFNQDGMAIAIVIVTLSTFAADARSQGVRNFGVPRGKLPFRGFGNPDGEEALRAKFPVAAASIVGEDRGLALKQVSITDANGDGKVTQKEWAESGFQTPSRFFTYDLNGDGILTVYEHSIGMARWRRRNERRVYDRETAETAARNLLDKKKKESSAPPEFLKEAPGTDPQVTARQQQVQKLANVLMGVYDINADGILERNEFQNRTSGFGNVSGADGDRDGKIQRDEIAEWLHHRLPPLSRLVMELQSRDLNHDDQVTFSEFSTINGSKSLEEFNRWDRNGDGFITPSESHSPQTVILSKYENNKSLVINPDASVVSDIWINDDVLIDRIRVHVKITKDNDNYTALFLLGPGGQKVTLYAGEGWQPWRGAQILDGVTFDDAAPLIKATLKQPPFRRILRPPGNGTRKQPVLNSFRGKSMRGKWRLIVRNQNNRVGLLSNWSLTVTPKRSVRK